MTANPAGAVLLWAAVAIAAPPALAADAVEPEAPCNQILPDEPNLHLGQITNAGPAAFLNDGPNCPGPAAACRSKSAARRA